MSTRKKELPRKCVKYKDQHGRTWEVTLDPETFMPCTLPIPFFNAPLEIPECYLRIPAEEMGHITIDYDRWISDWRERDKEYSQELRVWALRMYRDGAANAIEQRLPELMEVVGEPPQALAFVRAARAENRWVLGLPHPATGEPYPTPQWAEGLLDRLAPQWKQALAGGVAIDEVEDASIFADEDERATALAAQRVQAKAAEVRDDEQWLDEDARFDLEDEHDPDAAGGGKVTKAGKAAGTRRNIRAKA